MTAYGDLDPEIAVRFFMARPARIRKTVANHRRAVDGPWCVSHDEHWPCFVLRCAEAARERLHP